MSFITRAAVILLMLTAVAGAQADEDSAAKLKRDFATKITWQGTLKSAMAEASKGKKLIFGYFTRSYSP